MSKGTQSATKAVTGLLDTMWGAFKSAFNIGKGGGKAGAAVGDLTLRAGAAPVHGFNRLGQSRIGAFVLGVIVLVGSVFAASKIFGKLRRPEAETMTPADLQRRQHAAYDAAYNRTVQQGAQSMQAELSGPADGKDPTYWQRTTGKMPGQAQQQGLSQPTPSI